MSASTMSCHLRRWRGIALPVAMLVASAAIPVAATPRAIPAHPVRAAAPAGNPLALEEGVSRAISIASADCNRDCRDDVVVGYREPSGGIVAVYPGSLRGLGADPVLVAVPVAPDLLVAGDVTADGIADVVAASRGATELWLVRGTRSGEFRTPEAIDAGGAITALAAGEFGGHNGRTSIAVGVARDAGAAVRILVADESGSLDAAVTIATPAAAAAFALGQFDASAPFDLAVAAGERVVGDLADERLHERVLATLRRAGIRLHAQEGGVARSSTGFAGRLCAGGSVDLRSTIGSKKAT